MSMKSRKVKRLPNEKKAKDTKGVGFDEKRAVQVEEAKNRESWLRWRLTRTKKKEEWDVVGDDETESATVSLPSKVTLAKLKMAQEAKRKKKEKKK